LSELEEELQGLVEFAMRRLEAVVGSAYRAEIVKTGVGSCDRSELREAFEAALKDRVKPGGRAARSWLAAEQPDELPPGLAAPQRFSAIRASQAKRKRRERRKLSSETPFGCAAERGLRLPGSKPAAGNLHQCARGRNNGGQTAGSPHRERDKATGPYLGKPARQDNE
jgi:hypothetical protein